MNLGLWPVRVRVAPLAVAAIVAVVLLAAALRRREPEAVVEWPAWDSYQAAVLARRRAG